MVTILLTNLYSNLYTIMATSANTLPVRDFYDSLPAEDKKSFRENVRVLSGLEYYQFTYRLRNNTWTPLELRAINKYVNKRGYGVVLIS